MYPLRYWQTYKHDGIIRLVIWKETEDKVKTIEACHEWYENETESLERFRKQKYPDVKHEQSIKRLYSIERCMVYRDLIEVIAPDDDSAKDQARLVLGERRSRHPDIEYRIIGEKLLEG